jgi:hypothetical protein
VNPVLTIPVWTTEDAAVALDWELERGRDPRCQALAAEPEIARQLCAGELRLDPALVAAAKADHNPLEVCQRLVRLPNADVRRYRERGWEWRFARHPRLARALGLDRRSALDHISDWLERGIRARCRCTARRPAVLAKVGLGRYHPKGPLEQLLLDANGPHSVQRSACEIVFDCAGRCDLCLGIESRARAVRVCAGIAAENLVEVEHADHGPSWIAVMPARVPPRYEPEVYYRSLELLFDES